MYKYRIYLRRLFFHSIQINNSCNQIEYEYVIKSLTSIEKQLNSTNLYIYGNFQLKINIYIINKKNYHTI
jgi:hypothetical protein